MMLTYYSETIIIMLNNNIMVEMIRLLIMKTSNHSLVVNKNNAMTSKQVRFSVPPMSLPLRKKSGASGFGLALVVFQSSH